MPHVQQTTPELVQADVGAAVARSARRSAAPSIFTVGFCFGGRNSWLAAASGHGLAGRSRLLRQSRRAQRRPGPAPARSRDERPDPGPAGRRRPEHHPADNQAFDAALTQAGVEHELVDLRRRPAQLLRPQARRIQRRLDRRVGPHPELHRRAQVRQTSESAAHQAELTLALATTELSRLGTAKPPPPDRGSDSGEPAGRETVRSAPETALSGARSAFSKAASAQRSPLATLPPARGAP